MIKRPRWKRVVSPIVLLVAPVLLAVTVVACVGLPPPLFAGIAVAAVLVLAGLLIVTYLFDVRRGWRYELMGEVSTEVNRAILWKENEGKVFATVLDYAFRILENTQLGSVLTMGDDGYLGMAASRGFDEAYVKAFRIRLEDTWQYRQTGGEFHDAIIVTPRMILKSGYKHDDWTWEYRSVLTAPLYIGNRLYGFLNLDSYHRKTFRPVDLEIMRWFRAQVEVCLMAREMYETALADSRVDGLTRFQSRTTFDETFAQTVDQAERYGEAFTLGMFDVDNLKTINDQWGHGAGDEVLKALADSLRRAARKSDVLGRYGGDEFVALFRNTDAPALVDRARHILEGLAANPPRFQGTPIPASFSYGFADFPAQGRTFQDLVAVADEQLYQVKTANKS